MPFNSQIQMFLEAEAVDYVGFADMTAYQNDLTAFGGKIVEGYTCGISIGIVLQNTIVDHLPNRFDMNVACQYKIHAYDVINQRLDLTASKLASFLNQRGFDALPIVSAEHSNIEEAIPTVSHKMIAHIAGLGWIGKNCLLITPEHGPRVRFTSILTNAPLDVVDIPIDQRCGDCDLCVKICPTRAIKGRNYVPGESREERFDFQKCQRYFAALKEKHPWGVCGMCLYACPHGRKSDHK